MIDLFYCHHYNQYYSESFVYTAFAFMRIVVRGTVG